MTLPSWIKETRELCDALRREPMVNITSLDGTVKEPLCCLMVTERDAILGAIPHALDEIERVTDVLRNLVELTEIMAVRIDSEFGRGRDNVDEILADPEESEGYADLIAARALLTKQEG